MENQDNGQGFDFKGQRRNQLMSLLILVAVIVGYTIYSRYFVKQISFSVNGTVATVADPYGARYDIDLTTLTGLGLRSGMDYGSPVDGTETDGLKCGLWQNDELGSYHLAVSEKNPACVLLRTEEDTLVFNYDKEEATQSVYQAIVSLTENYGLSIPGM